MKTIEAKPVTTNTFKEVVMEPEVKTAQELFEEELQAACESLETLQAEEISSLNYSCCSCWDQFNENELGADKNVCPTCGEDTVFEN